MLHHWNACRDLLIYILHICRNQREKALNTDPWKYQGALYISEHVNERSVSKLVNRAKLYLIRIHFWKAVISRAVVLLRISKNLGLLGRARGQTNYPALQVANNMWVFTSFLNFFFLLWATFGYREALAAHHFSQKLSNLPSHNTFCVLWYSLELCLHKTFQKQVYHSF